MSGERRQATYTTRIDRCGVDASMRAKTGEREICIVAPDHLVTLPSLPLAALKAYRCTPYALPARSGVACCKSNRVSESRRATVSSHLCTVVRLWALIPSCSTHVLARLFWWQTGSPAYTYDGGYKMSGETARHEAMGIQAAVG